MNLKVECFDLVMSQLLKYGLASEEDISAMFIFNQIYLLFLVGDEAQGKQPLYAKL